MIDLKELSRTLSRLAPRWFLMRNAHVPEAGSVLLNPRHTMSLMRGPLTREETRSISDFVARPRSTAAEAPSIDSAREARAERRRATCRGSQHYWPACVELSQAHGSCERRRLRPSPSSASMAKPKSGAPAPPDWPRASEHPGPDDPQI
jgi:hypothetical protein